MAIRVDRTAIVSLGLSCQVTHQITSNLPLIASLTGADPQSMTTPFDWNICPAQSAARMIRDWRFYPEDPASLVVDLTPYWPEIPCWFYHDAERLEAGTFLSREAHLAENLERVQEAERQVFILANTQKNLTNVARRVVHPMSFIFKDRDINALRAALAARLPNGADVISGLRGIGSPTLEAWPRIELGYADLQSAA